MRYLQYQPPAKLILLFIRCLTIRCFADLTDGIVARPLDSGHNQKFTDNDPS